MSCSKIIQSFKSELLENYIKYFTNETSNSLFIGIGRTLPWNRNALFDLRGSDDSELGNDSIVPLSLDSDQEKSVLRRNMFFIKEISPNDFSFLVRNYEWESGQIYDNYRNEDQLFEEPKRNFFIYNSLTKGVYKCLDNNDRSPSTVIPSEVSNSVPFQTADGYTWKLMYRLTDDQETKFGIKGFDDLNDFIPVKFIDYSPTITEEIQQKQFQDSSLNGSIEFVDINSEFKEYIGLDRDICTFNDSCFLYADSPTGSTTIDIHQCTLKVGNTGAGALANLVFSAENLNGLEIQRRLIDDSKQVILQLDANGASGEDGLCITYVKLHLRHPTDRFLPKETRYRIEPWIKVLGDGESDGITSNSTIGLNSAEFKPVFNHESGANGVSRIRSIKVIDKGKNYLYAKAFFPSAGAEGSTSPNFVGINYLGPMDISTTGTTENQSIFQRWLNNSTNLLIPVLPPLGGHGSNPLKELGSSDLLLKTIFQGNEENKLTPENDFRQIFLIKNPELNNPIIHLRFDTALPEEMEIGTQIFDGENSGIVKKIYNYSQIGGGGGMGVTGFELLVDSISGSFENSSGITGLGNIGALTLSQSRFSDSYKEYKIAGTENKNLMIVRTTNQSAFTGKVRDVAIGCGSTGSNKISPSFASGMIRNLVVVGNNIDIFLEDFSGRFKEGENVMIVPKNSNINPSIQTGFVLGTRYQKENVLDVGYSLITKIEIQQDDSEENFDQFSFENDQLIYSYSECPVTRKSETEEIIGNGHLFSYQILSNSTAIIEVVGAKYNAFQVGQVIPYGSSINCAVINKVTESEIKYDSGEVLHINNLEPVARSSSSREEVNLVISL
jgi:hypothetical protein